ncbi:deoxyuridine 5'-triphosphate nucleotidohydrolase [Staphylococcus aureus]|uniref:Deoxyuridine 5'-triphosphate nucleotidohydrolase n=1 Tax=Staphylococcus aureus TaxID=1280 RepID=A0A380DM98_STAAU|nr:deoxyuridine 5'-triphosphate nucleotidohydrolase [Staphylococcus aureus]
MTNILQVKLLSENARMPERNHKTDAGYDIFSAETVVLEPQEKAVIKNRCSCKHSRGLCRFIN